MTRRALATLLSAVACLVAACGSSGVTRDAKADEKTAQELADRLFPGELTVLGSESIFPRDTGSKVTFSVRDDPDAAVRVDVDSHRDTLEQRLRDAVSTGRAQAAELRLLTGAFRDCGREIIGIEEIAPYSNDVLQITAWVAAPITNATVSALLSQLDGCITAWGEKRAGSDSPWKAKHTNLSLNIVSSAEPSTLTGPTYLRLTDRDLIKTLAGSEHYRTLTLDGQQSVGDVLFPAMSFEGAKLESAARDWLAKADVNPKPRIGRYLSLANRLEPGTVDRMRAYVTVCYSASESPPCEDEGAIGFTVDRPTGATRDFTLIRKVKDNDGKYRYPFEKP
jgi:hypothetical protein